MADGRRRALVVATGAYTDAALAGLRAPGRDAEELAAVLEDAAIGGFEVETVLDAPADVLRRHVARFCAAGGPGDLALLYVSCHGVLDDRGRLYYATVDTDRALLAATALPAAWLNEQLDDCRCRRQVLVLDCCHSGAFAKGAKGEGALALGKRFEGRGRVVLTASRATEYSFEGDRVLGDGVASVFTDVLVQGLRSGDADRDRDGAITVTELYDYAYDAVRARDARQTPMLWTYGAEGGLLVARSTRVPIVEPVPLPDELVSLLESSRPRLRESAVAELAELLAGPDPGRALTAREHLERVAAEDIPSVAVLARAALGDGGAVAPPQVDPPPDAEPPPTAPPPPPPRRRSAAWLLAAAAGALVAVVGAAVLLSGDDGSPTAPSGSPEGIAAGDGRLWVARHDPGTLSRLAPAPPLSSPAEVDDDLEKVVAGQGVLWASSESGRRLVRIDPKTGKRAVQSPAARGVSDIVNLRRGCDCPLASLVITPDTLWVGRPDKNTIQWRDPHSGKNNYGGRIGLGEGFSGIFTASRDSLWALGEENGQAWLRQVDLANGTPFPPQFLDDIHAPSGVAYGGPSAVWIVDTRAGRDVVTRYDPTQAATPRPIPIPKADNGDDIAVAPDGTVLVWQPFIGLLTSIEPGTYRKFPHKISGYVTGSRRNSLHSDLAVYDGQAWVTDPTANAIHHLTY